MSKKIVDIIKEARLPKIKMPQRSAQERMYQHHQELRKKAGLPDESYYEKMAAQKKKELEDMKNEEVNLEEAVNVSHERYMRSHGKQASEEDRGMWAFTHKRFGGVDYNNNKEFHTTTGSFKEAKKSAKKWAKEHGHQTAYVMEEVEQIDELSKDTLSSYIKKAAPHAVSSTRTAEHLRKVSDRAAKEDDHKKAGEYQGYSDKFQKGVFKRIAGIQRAAGKLAKEEVDLNEVSMSDAAKMAHDLKTAKEKRDVEKHEKDLTSAPINKPDYDVVVHHKHDDGTEKDYTYRVTKAKNDKHAQNIAMLRHHEKLGGGNFKSSLDKDVKRLNEGDEHLHKDHIEKSLADSDINSSVEGNTVRVHSSNTKKAARLLKNMGYEHKVAGGLNESIGIIREVVKKKVEDNRGTKGKTATGQPMPKVEVNPESKVV